MSLAVEMTGISKRFGAVQALDSVDLHVPSGSIHAVVGENGAGKSTLMNVLYGAVRPDAGTISIEGNPVQIQSSAQAIELGIGMVSQHYGIIPGLTCLQNLILGAEGSALLDIRRAEARAQSLSEKMGFQFDWQRDAAELSPAGAQKLEILKLLWRNSRIMILDEPTAMLSPSDGKALFDSLEQLAHEGNTILLVTHRLPEVFDHCQSVSVLRGGRKVAEKSVADTHSHELAELIVGRSLESASVHAPTLGPPVLQLKGLSVLDRRGHRAVKSVDLRLHAGEVVGVAGVDGSGQRELVHSILGVLRPAEGSALLGEVALDSLSSGERLAQGMRVIPEDRHDEGVIEEWSLEENAGLGLHRSAPFAKGIWVDESKRGQAAVAIASRFETKHGGLGQPISSLSGGNQQRFVAARALFGEPKLILAYQPARGLDLAATRSVYEGIQSACDHGAAALVVSYDLDELIDHCDRIVVMNRGELREAPQGHERDREAIGRLMVAAE